MDPTGVYIKASNTDAGDLFGSSVALWGDTLAVGARGEDSASAGIDGNESDNTASQSGAVYVFTRSAGAWSQQAYVKASNTGTNDRFGRSVALWSDTLAVGASGESSAATGVGGCQTDNSKANSGAAYVFLRSGGSWSQQAYIKASNTDDGDFFGVRLALWADTLAVSATGEDSAAEDVDGNQADNSATSSGAVYVFTRSGNTWTQQAYVKAANTEELDSFGESLALWGDVLAVGASREDSSATGINGALLNNGLSNSGAVYVYTRVNDWWGPPTYVKASNTGASDAFGWSVCLWADTLVVGAYREESAATGFDGDETDNTMNSAGAVYIFQ